MARCFFGTRRCVYAQRRAMPGVLARVRAEGPLIGTVDLSLGCQALAEGDVLATHNTQAFERIDGLARENRAQPGIAA